MIFAAICGGLDVFRVERVWVSEQKGRRSGRNLKSLLNVEEAPRIDFRNRERSEEQGILLTEVILDQVLFPII